MTMTWSSGSIFLRRAQHAEAVARSAASIGQHHRRPVLAQLRPCFVFVAGLDDRMPLSFEGADGASPAASPCLPRAERGTACDV
jgi:hypothetical protein